MKNYVEQTVKEFGTIDGFYNNAGIEGKQTPLVEYDTDIFKKVIDINLLGVFYGMKYIIPVMIKNGGGKIVLKSLALRTISISIHCHFSYRSAYFSFR